VVIPPVVDFITANNVSDKPFYPDLISCLSSETLKKIHYMVTDPQCDDQKLYDFSMGKGFQRVCSVRRYKNTPEERKKHWLIFINRL
jgi:hypothetical protein